MKKIMDKLHTKVTLNKNLIVFLVILLLVGVMAGSIFTTVLNQEDKTLIIERLNLFLDNVSNNNIDYLNVLKSNVLTNIFYILTIWLLGISVIGLPIIIIMYFSKTFILGFTIGSILTTFKLKGILFSLIYVFPGNVISLLFYLLLTMYAMSFSFKLIYAIFKKRTFDFRKVTNRYFKILLLVLVVCILMNLYDTFIMPKLVNFFMTFIR